MKSWHDVSVRSGADLDQLIALLGDAGEFAEDPGPPLFVWQWIAATEERIDAEELQDSRSKSRLKELREKYGEDWVDGVLVQGLRLLDILLEDRELGFKS